MEFCDPLHLWHLSEKNMMPQNPLLTSVTISHLLVRTICTIAGGFNTEGGKGCSAKKAGLFLIYHTNNYLGYVQRVTT